MQKKNNYLFRLDDLRRASWLPLLTLAWLYLSATTHQFEHVADYPSETCETCAQFSRVDDLTVDRSVVADVAPTPFRLRAVSSQEVILSAERPAFSSRAPPRR